MKNLQIPGIRLFSQGIIRCDVRRILLVRLEAVIVPHDFFQDYHERSRRSIASAVMKSQRSAVCAARALTKKSR